MNETRIKFSTKCHRTLFFPFYLALLWLHVSMVQQWAFISACACVFLFCRMRYPDMLFGLLFGSLLCTWLGFAGRWEGNGIPRMHVSQSGWGDRCGDSSGMTSTTALRWVARLSRRNRSHSLTLCQPVAIFIRPSLSLVSSRTVIPILWAGNLLKDTFIECRGPKFEAVYRIW